MPLFRLPGELTKNKLSLRTGIDDALYQNLVENECIRISPILADAL